MKKCPYCGHEVSDEATNCTKCFAGFPHEEPKEEQPVEEMKRVSKRKRS